MPGAPLGARYRPRARSYVGIEHRIRRKPEKDLFSRPQSQQWQVLQVRKRVSGNRMACEFSLE